MSTPEMSSFPAKRDTMLSAMPSRPFFSQARVGWIELQSDTAPFPNQNTDLSSAFFLMSLIVFPAK